MLIDEIIKRKYGTGVTFGEDDEDEEKKKRDEAHSLTQDIETGTVIDEDFADFERRFNQPQGPVQQEEPKELGEIRYGPLKYYQTQEVGAGDRLVDDVTSAMPITVEENGEQKTYYVYDKVSPGQANKNYEEWFRSQYGEEQYDKEKFEEWRLDQTPYVEYASRVQEAELAWSQYVEDGTIISRKLAEKAEERVKEIEEVYPKLKEPATDEITSAIRTTLEYIPQAGYYIKNNAGAAIAAGVIGTGAGGVAGAVTKNPSVGIKVGTATAKAVYDVGSLGTSYEATRKLTQGALFRELINMGVPEEKARLYAKSSAVDQALVEVGSEGTQKAVEWAIALLFPAGSIGGKIASTVTGGRIADILTEAGEEAIQEQQQLNAEKAALISSGLDTSDYTPEYERERRIEAAKGGATIAAGIGQIQGGASSVTTSLAANNINKVQLKTQYNQSIKEANAEKAKLQSQLDTDKNLTGKQKYEIQQQIKDIDKTIDALKAVSTSESLSEQVSNDAVKLRNYATQNAPLYEAMANPPVITDQYGNQTVDTQAQKKNIEDKYNTAISEARKAGDTNALAQLEIGKMNALNEKNVADVIKEGNEALDKQKRTKNQTFNEQRTAKYTQKLNQEQAKIRESFPSATLTLADKITPGQEALIKFGKILGKDVVFFNASGIRNNDSVYIRNGMLELDDTNTIYLNTANRTTKNALATLGHEYAHSNVKKHPELIKDINEAYTNKQARDYMKSKNTNFVLTNKDIQTYKEQLGPESETVNYQLVRAKEEMYSDSVGEYFSNADTVKKIEAGDTSIFRGIKNTASRLFENATGINPNFGSVNKYNLGGESKLHGQELNEKLKKQIDKETGAKESKKSSKKETDNKAKVLTPEQKKNETWYKQQKEDGKSRAEIQRGLASRMNKGINSKDVLSELSRLENKYNDENATRFSDRIIDNSSENNYNVKNGGKKDEEKSRNFKRNFGAIRYQEADKRTNNGDVSERRRMSSNSVENSKAHRGTLHSERRENTEYSRNSSEIIVSRQKQLESEIDVYQKIIDDNYEKEIKIDGEKSRIDIESIVDKIYNKQVLSNTEMEDFNKYLKLTTEHSKLEDEDIQARRQIETLSNILEREKIANRTPEAAFKIAKEEFGTTTDYKKAAYLLLDGDFVDFSGAKQGNLNASRRTIDHYAIDITGYNMLEFIGLGAVRIKPETGGFELAVRPTYEQISALKSYIDWVNIEFENDPWGKIFVDIIGAPRDKQLKPYEIGTKSAKIINDINKYFDDSKTANQFRNSDEVREGKKKWDGRAKDQVSRIKSYTDTIKLKDGYKITITPDELHPGRVSITLEKDTYDGMVVAANGKHISKYEPVKSFDVYKRPLKGDKGSKNIQITNYNGYENFMEAIKNRVKTEFKEAIPQTKLDKTEDALKRAKAEKRGQGRVLKYSFKKNNKQKAQTAKFQAKAEKAKEKFEGLRAAYKQRNQEKATQKRIRGLQDELLKQMKRFEKSETFKFMTDEQKATYNETFGNIYRKAKSKKDKTRALELAKAELAKELIANPNIDVSEKVKRLANAPAQITLSEFKTEEQLKEVLDAYTKIVEQVRRQQEILSLQKNTTSQEEKDNFAQAVKEQSDKARAKSLKKEAQSYDTSTKARIASGLERSINSKVRTLAHIYNNQVTTLETMLLDIAGGDRSSYIMEPFKKLDRGVTRERYAYTQLHNSINELLEDKEYQSVRESINPKKGWHDTGFTVTDDEGNDHKLYLNGGYEMALALHRLQDQSMKHISGQITDIVLDEDGFLEPLSREGGGIVIPNMQLAREGKPAEAIAAGYTAKLEKEQLDDILGTRQTEDGLYFDNLSKEQNEFIRKLNDFFELTYQLSNEVYRATHGYDMPKSNNYFPIVSSNAYMFKNDDEKKLLTKSGIQQVYGIGDNASFIKSRSDKAFNPIVLENVGDVITRMINGVSKYYGYELALHDNNVLLNTKVNNKTAKSELDKIYGLDTKNYSFSKSYDDLVSFITGNKSLSSGMFAKFRGRHAEFTLGLNPGSWVKQLLSVPTTMKYFTAKEIASFIAGGEKELHETMKAFLQSRGDYNKKKVLHDFARYLTPDLDYRDIGFGVADARDLTENKSIFKKINVLKGIERFDMMGVNTVTRMFLFAELSRRNLLGNELLKLSPEEVTSVFDEVGSELEHMLRQTQPDYSQVYSANIKRNPSILARFETMYATPMLQMVNNFAQSSLEFRNNKNKASFTNLVKSGLGIIAASYGGMLITSAVSGLLNPKDEDDEDEAWKKFVVNLLGPTLILDDIASAALGLDLYDSQTPELIAYDALVSLFKDIPELMFGKEKNKLKTFETIVRNVGLVTGIPTRDIMKIFKTILRASDSELYYDYLLKTDQYATTNKAYGRWQENEELTSEKEYYKAYKATRDKNLEKNYGYQKGDKEAGIESNLKESREEALRDLFDDEAKVQEYMGVLFDYKE